MFLEEGIGCDVLDVARFEKVYERRGEPFLERLFSKKEREYCDQYKGSALLHYAGRFAAKEAIVKALGLGFRDGITFLDIEIVNDGLGRPRVFLAPFLNEKLKFPNILVSISHTKTTAFAVAHYKPSENNLL